MLINSKMKYPPWDVGWDSCGFIHHFIPGCLARFPAPQGDSSNMKCVNSKTSHCC